MRRMRRVILASGSPRRRELLAQTGLKFEVIPADVDEAAVIAAIEITPAAAGVAEESETRSAGASVADGSETQPDGVSAADGSEAQPAGASVADGSEVPPADEPVSRPYPARVVEALSAAKAESVAAEIEEGIIIGADTVVWNGAILGKPKDRADARAMLRSLQGQTHSVFTGVTVLVKEAVRADAEGCEVKGKKNWDEKENVDQKESDDGSQKESQKKSDNESQKESQKESDIGSRKASDNENRKESDNEIGNENSAVSFRHTFFCETRVRVYPMTEQETEQYLDFGEYADKAGAYGIQGKFGLWVQGIEGDYNNVVGLPLSALWQILRQCEENAPVRRGAQKSTP